MIKLAIIGTGIMGADHARIFAREISGAEVKVICDANAERAKMVAAEYGADIETDAEVAINRDDVDAVVIASPDFTHAPLSMACIKAGKPVLCEKPLSQSSAECLQVMDAEAKAGRRFVQLGFMRRYDQSYQEMRRAVADGSLGRILMMHNFHRNVETPASDFTADMAITNSAPHEFDVVRYVLGVEYRSISAFRSQRSDALVPPVFMVIETEEGQLINIEINNNASYGYDVRGELIGQKGSIEMRGPQPTLRNQNLEINAPYDADWRARYFEAYRQQNKDFLDFVRTGEFPETGADCWDGYATAVIAEKGVEALITDQKIHVSMAEKPALYS